MQKTCVCCGVRFHSFFVVSLIASIPVADAADGLSTDRYEEASEIRKVEFLSGEEANPGNFLFPSLSLQATGGLCEPGASPDEMGFPQFSLIK